jgi:hypothetical protein
MSSSKVETWSQATLPFGEDYTASRLMNSVDMITKNRTPENVWTSTEDLGAGECVDINRRSQCGGGPVYSALESNINRCGTFGAGNIVGGGRAGWEV